MCSKCKEISAIWDRRSKTTEGVNFLRQAVPEHFIEVKRYYDLDLKTTVYMMQCKHCGQIFQVPH